MAKQIIDFGIAGLAIGNCTWQACQKASDNSAVATAGSTLTAIDSAGKYWLENPNVTADTLFDIYPTATPAARRLGLFRAPTAIDICNDAILGLGGNAIASFSDGSAAATLCNNLWARAIDAVLRLHPWNCAIKRLAIAAPDATVPTYEWSAAFSLPSDLLRLLDMDGLKDYRVENGKVLCNESALNIRYVYRHTDPAGWDALLVQTVTGFLSFLLAYPITKSNTTRGEQWKLFTELLRTARNVDAQEEPGEEVGDFPFISVRG